MDTFCFSVIDELQADMPWAKDIVLWHTMWPLNKQHVAWPLITSLMNKQHAVQTQRIHHRQSAFAPRTIAVDLLLICRVLEGRTLSWSEHTVIVGIFLRLYVLMLGFWHGLLRKTGVRAAECSTWLHTLIVYAFLSCMSASSCGLPAVARSKGDWTVSPELASWASLLLCPLYWTDVWPLWCAGRARTYCTVKLWMLFISLLYSHNNKL